jgi:hypothetical protein
MNDRFEGLRLGRSGIRIRSRGCVARFLATDEHKRNRNDHQCEQFHRYRLSCFSVAGCVGTPCVCGANLLNTPDLPRNNFRGQPRMDADGGGGPQIYADGRGCGFPQMYADREDGVLAGREIPAVVTLRACLSYWDAL